MKITLSQLNFTVGSFEENTRKIVRELQIAKNNQVDVVVFSDLAIGGFPAFDLCRTDSFIEKTAKAIDEIKAKCIGISCVVGGVYEKNGKLYNAAYYLEGGEVQNVITKNQLASLDWYDERRYFNNGEGCQIVNLKGEELWIALGDDIHSIPADSTANGIIHLQNKAFSIGSYEERLEELSQVSAKYQLPIFQPNQVGGQGDILFDGRSLVMARDGRILVELEAFKEDSTCLVTSTLGVGVTVQKEHSKDVTDISLIHEALVMGIRDFFSKQGFQKAVLGLSGGLDSALVAALTCEAIGAANVLAVLLPSIYSSDHSLKDALDLVGNSGCQHQVIPINEVVVSFESILAPLFEGRKSDLTEENIQARIRGLILMAISNKLGHIVLNTSNKSECAVGYGTLYGDMVGSLSVIGDIYKTQAFELAKYMNREREIIPMNTIIKPPSAELRPDQKDSDSLPDYPLMDAILFQYIEEGKSSAQIIVQGFEKETVERVTGLVDRAEFKRFQAAPILRVSKKAFGRARQMPVVFKL